MENKSSHDVTKVESIGQQMYKEVLGKSVFDENHPAPLVGVRELTVNHLFANIWSRSREDTREFPRISLRERRLVTIALLAAQGRVDQLKEHVAGAYHAKIAKESLIELMVHIAHYAGWAAGTSGQKIILEVYEKESNE